MKIKFKLNLNINAEAWKVEVQSWRITIGKESPTLFILTNSQANDRISFFPNCRCFMEYNY